MNLNLGGGYDKINGFKNVDFRPEVKPDYLANFEDENSLYEIKDNSVDKVLASHVFEHITNLEGLMKEIYRVCKNGAEIIIRTPYWSHHTAVEDPTHVRYFTEESMMYFDKDTTGSDNRRISIPYNFKQINVGISATKEYKHLSIPEIFIKAHKYLNVIVQLQFNLKVVK